MKNDSQPTRRRQLTRSPLPPLSPLLHLHKWLYIGSCPTRVPEKDSKAFKKIGSKLFEEPDFLKEKLTKHERTNLTCLVSKQVLIMCIVLPGGAVSRNPMLAAWVYPHDDG